MEIFIKDSSQSNIVQDRILPLFAPLVASSNTEVSKAAIKAIVETAPLICSEEKGQGLFFVILTAVHDDSNEELRTAAIELLGETAESFGANLCESFIAPDIESLVDSESVKLRKATALILPKVAKVMRRESFIQRLAPVYIKFCNDTIWSIRKAALEGLSDILKLSNPVLKAEVVEVMKKGLKDKSRWVKLTAQQQLGPFIIEFGKDVDDEILQAYLKLSASDSESENKSSCAFYLPGVLLTLGAEAWSTLQPTFNQMCIDEQVKVRKSLAASMHELGRILGPAKAESDLARPYESFMKDRDANVRLTALLNLNNFLETLSVASRELFLNELNFMIKQSENWRLREVVARQIPKLANLFSLDATFNDLLPMAMSVSLDKVGAVRRSGAPGLGLILVRLHFENEEWGLQLVEKLKDLANSKSYFDRQTFVQGCSLVTTSPVFTTLLADSFSKLSDDPVANVRLCVAQVIKSAVESAPTEYWIKLARKLKVDSDDDVKYSAGGNYDSSRGLQKDLKATVIKPTLEPLLKRPSKDAAIEAEEISFICSKPVLIQFLRDPSELENEYPLARLEV